MIGINPFNGNYRDKEVRQAITVVVSGRATSKSTVGSAKSVVYARGKMIARGGGGGGRGARGQGVLWNVQ